MGIYRKVINKLLGSKIDLSKSNIENYTDIHESSLKLGTPKIDCRNPKVDRIYVQIGENSKIDGTCIFESPTGKVKIGDRVFIGASKMISINEIEFENDIYVAWGTYFYDHDSHSLDHKERVKDRQREVQDILSGKKNSIISKDWSTVKSAKIKVCSHAWIGMNCLILKGVTIGEGAVVGAGSVVVKDVEPWTVVGGNPARILKKLDKKKG